MGHFKLQDVRESPICKITRVILGFATSLVLIHTFPYTLAGCGVNLSNSNPTGCINDAVRQHNLDHNTSLPELDRETFLARVFNVLEDLIDTFQSVGPGAVKPLYYKYWLHR